MISCLKINKYQLFILLFSFFNLVVESQEQDCKKLKTEKHNNVNS